MTRPLTSSQDVQLIDPQNLTRSQRLERWARALEKIGDVPLRTLRETEYRTVRERLTMREDNSPLTVAFEEPVLRSAGLRDDTYGEARRFFDLPDWDLHNVLCYCHSGTTVRASDVARRVRAIEARTAPGKYIALQCGAVATAAVVGAGLLLVFAA